MTLKDNLKFILMLPTFPFFLIYHNLLWIKSAIILKRRNERVTYDNVMYDYADRQCDILFCPTMSAMFQLYQKGIVDERSLIEGIIYAKKDFGTTNKQILKAMEKFKWV